MGSCRPRRAGGAHCKLPKDKKPDFWAERNCSPIWRRDWSCQGWDEGFVLHPRKKRGLGERGCLTRSDSLPGEVVPTGAHVLSDSL